MRPVLLLHGPNLNFLGRRDARHYGTITLTELESKARAWGRELGFDVQAFQSNHEGQLIDKVQEAAGWAAGAVVNAGALSHTSYALHDALLDFDKPVVEVHLSNVNEREPWRKISVLRPACAAAVEGRGADGYRNALQALARILAAAPE